MGAGGTEAQGAGSPGVKLGPGMPAPELPSLPKPGKWLPASPGSTVANTAKLTGSKWPPFDIWRLL